MNKTTAIVLIVIIVLVVGVGILLYSNSQNNNSSTNNSSSSSISSDTSLLNISSSSSQSSSKSSILITNRLFSPSSITVPVGTTVTWTNQDSYSHNIVENTGAFNSGLLSNGSTFSYTFTSAGTFNYNCSIHPDMTGSIVVTQ